jgi:hypothetical protein
MSASGTDYDFQPLDTQRNEIRLLTIKPTFWKKSPISCSLQVGSLDSASLPKYAALSYCWGNGPADQAIDCDGSIIRVTSSLLDALRSLRKLTRLYLWIDQICINQTDLEERGSQVPLMKRIYSGAVKTFLHLCPSNEFPRRLVNLLRLDPLLIYAGRRKNLAIKLRVWRLLLHFGTGNLYRVVPALADQPCFSRAWIVQEISLSANVKVICRGLAIGWAQFELMTNDCFDYAILHHIKHNTDVLDSFDFVHFGVAVAVGRSKGAKPLWDVLLASNGIEASDPRDRIYALLGLAEDAEDFPPPDYQLSVADVYRSFASIFVTKGHGADLLSLTSSPVAKDQAYPSWVPDWEQEFENLKFQGQSNFSAGRHDGPFHVEVGNCVLSTEGLIVDTVLWTWPPPRRESIGLDITHTFEQLLEFVRSTATAIQNNSEVLKGFFFRVSVVDLQLMLILYLVSDHEGGYFSAALDPPPPMMEGALAKAFLAPNAPSLEVANDFVAGALTEHLSRGFGDKGFMFFAYLLNIARWGRFAIPLLVVFVLRLRTSSQAIR